MFRSPLFDAWIYVGDKDKKQVEQISDLIFDYSKSEREDITEWLTETQYSFNLSLNGYKTRIYFDNKQSAVEFKLRFIE